MIAANNSPYSIISLPTVFFGNAHQSSLQWIPRPVYDSTGEKSPPLLISSLHQSWQQVQLTLATFWMFLGITHYVENIEKVFKGFQVHFSQSKPWESFSVAYQEQNSTYLFSRIVISSCMGVTLRRKQTEKVFTNLSRSFQSLETLRIVLCRISGREQHSFAIRVVISSCMGVTRTLRKI
jgi:hypothetical protein